jgi:MFS family permease
VPSAQAVKQWHGTLGWRLVKKAKATKPMHGEADSLPEKRTAQQPAWYSGLTGYQWLVFAAAALGWLFDTMDQQLFNLARMPAVSELLNVQDTDPLVKTWGGLATMIFMIGWATGGIIFGILGDRAGRVRTMLWTILVYSAFTGLSALAVSVWDFALYRFLTGLGVGGEFAVGVALVAEVMPDAARPHALGWLQACSALGNMVAAGISWILGRFQTGGVISNSWRAMFFVGLLPALLAFFVMRYLKEPERWKAAAAAPGAKQKLGSLKELFGNPQLRKRTVVGLLLATSGVVGLWGIAFFVYDLIRLVLGEKLIHQGLSKEAIKGELTSYVGLASFLLNLGGFFGVYAFSRFTHRLGRKPAFAISFVLALLGTASTFWFFDTAADLYWTMPILGFCVLTLFGGYAIYFPELFPTRLRSTGTSFCYNVGRYLAAPGPLTLGLLASHVFGAYGPVMSFRYAGVTMCGCFLLGLIALPFAPETRGQPLPD